MWGEAVFTTQRRWRCVLSPGWEVGWGPEHVDGSQPAGGSELSHVEWLVKPRCGCQESSRWQPIKVAETGVPRERATQVGRQQMWRGWWMHVCWKRHRCLKLSLYKWLSECCFKLLGAKEVYTEQGFTFKPSLLSTHGQALLGTDWSSFSVGLWAAIWGCEFHWFSSNNPTVKLRPCYPLAAT